MVLLFVQALEPFRSRIDTITFVPSPSSFLNYGLHLRTMSVLFIASSAYPANVFGILWLPESSENTINESSPHLHVYTDSFLYRFFG